MMAAHLKILVAGLSLGVMCMLITLTQTSLQGVSTHAKPASLELPSQQNRLPDVQVSGCLLLLGKLIFFIDVLGTLVRFPQLGG